MTFSGEAGRTKGVRGLADKASPRVSVVIAEPHRTQTPSETCHPNRYRHLSRTGRSRIWPVGSLLGRTYLVCGKVEAADECVRKGFEIIPAGNSKDYLDLKLLAGDLEARRKNWESAEQHYTEGLEQSIPDDRERSEIVARCHLRRAKAREALGRVQGAKMDYESASEIWMKLDERAFATEAEWSLIRLTTAVPKEHVALFSTEVNARARVKAFRAYEAKWMAAKGAVAHKRKPPQGQIEHLLAQARKEVSMEPEW